MRKITKFSDVRIGMTANHKREEGKAGIIDTLDQRNRIFRTNDGWWVDGDCFSSDW